MPKPLNLINRLTTLLESANATIVDMSSIYDKRKALNNSRAPAIGWRDYINNKDYEPPTYAKNPKHFYGPEDGTAWNRNSEGGPSRIQSNPYSKKYGGVRPWSPDEIAETMLDDAVTPGYFPHGIRSIINKFRRHQQAAQPGIEFNAEEYLGPAMDMLNMAIEKDQGRVGTEFTKYLSLNMDLTGGAPAGFRGEHRTIRGILTKLSKMINKIANKVESDDYDPKALITTIGKLGSKKVTLDSADPNIPRAKNELGGFAGRLKKLYDDFARLIESGDADGIHKMRDVVAELYDDVDEEEGIYSGEGMSHGRLGSQPRDLPAIGTTTHRINPTKFMIYVADPDLEKMDSQKVNKSPGKLTKKDIIIKRDPKSGEPAMRYLGTIESDSKARAISASRDTYAKQESMPKQLVAFLPFSAEESEEQSGAGLQSISGLTVTGKGGDQVEHPGLPGVVHQSEMDPEFKEELTELLSSFRYGSSKQKIGQAHRALDIVGHLFSIVEHTTNPKSRPNLEARPDLRTARGAFKSGGYNIINTENDQIVARADDEREASKIMQRINNPVTTSFKYISNMLTRSKVGDTYYDDLSDMVVEIAQAVQSGNDDMLVDILEELRMTKSFIEDDIKKDPTEHAPILTEREYRIALRKLGISNYPEKGTVNDPEIDERGNLSKWAQAGYPLIQKDTSGGRGELSGTLYAPGEENIGELVVDKHIASDLGISAQSVGNIWRKMQDKLSKIVEQLYEHHVWSNDLDKIDLMILRETCNKIAMIMAEEIRYAARLMLE